MDIKAIDASWFDRNGVSKVFPGSVENWWDSKNKYVDWFTVTHNGKVFAVFGLELDVDLDDNEVGTLYSFEMSNKIDHSNDKEVTETVTQFVSDVLQEAYTFDIDTSDFTDAADDIEEEEENEEDEGDTAKDDDENEGSEEEEEEKVEENSISGAGKYNDLGLTENGWTLDGEAIMSVNELCDMFTDILTLYNLDNDERFTAKINRVIKEGELRDCFITIIDAFVTMDGDTLQQYGITNENFPSLFAFLTELTGVDITKTQYFDVWVQNMLHAMYDNEPSLSENALYDEKDIRQTAYRRVGDVINLIKIKYVDTGTLSVFPKIEAFYNSPTDDEIRTTLRDKIQNGITKKDLSSTLDSVKAITGVPRTDLENFQPFIEPLKRNIERTSNK